MLSQKMIECAKLKLVHFDTRFVSQAQLCGGESAQFHEREIE